MGFWRDISIDMMSDEEDVCSLYGLSSCPPSFRSRELTDLCTMLQAKLEPYLKYTTMHHRRLHIGPHLDRMSPNTYDTMTPKRHFKAHLMLQILYMCDGCLTEHRCGVYKDSVAAEARFLSFYVDFAFDNDHQ